MTRSRRSSCRAIVCLLPLLAACTTENDEQLVEHVGVTRLYLVDPSLLVQSVGAPNEGGVPPDQRIQAARWEVSVALLSLDDILLDLLGGRGDCTFTDTVRVNPVVGGSCASGIVVESSGDPYTMGLALAVHDMQVARAEPLDLSETVDFDGDFVPNDGDGSGSAFDAPCGLNGLTSNCDDNCPLVPNADQADGNQNGTGDACTLSGSRDSDADGTIDSSDNCIWIANADQADTGGLGGDAIADGIGDACTEQVAVVQPFVLDLDRTTLNQPDGSTTFVTVDFDSLRALDCDWRVGTCTLDPAAVTLCTGATSGCD